MSLFNKLKPSKVDKEVLKRSIALKKKKRIGRAVILSILAVLILAGFVYLFYCPALTINKVYVQGNSIVKTEDIIKDVQDSLSGKSYFIFPHHSILIYSQLEIEKNLLHDFPRLTQAAVGLNDTNSLLVDVKERNNDLIWCRSYSGKITASSSPEETGDRECYFADPSGYIFATAPYFSGNVFSEIDGLLSDEPIGTAPLAKDNFSEVRIFLNVLPSVLRKGYPSLRVLAVNLLEPGEYEAEIMDTAKANCSWRILFKEQQDPGQLADNLLAVLSSETFIKDSAKKDSALDYIDLRIPNKVFYKFK